VRPDHKVDFKTEETIAARALRRRSRTGRENVGYFNIAVFVEQDLSQDPQLGPVEVVFDIRPGQPLAYVTHTPRKMLHIEREVWDLAGQGEPEARYILAHEIGHLDLHDNTAQAFSDNPDLRIKFAENEYSAEWQADRYADHFLLPTHIVLASCDEDDLVRLGVTRDLVRRRLLAVRPKPKLKIMMSGDFCSCGGTYRGAEKLVCDACGHTTKRFSFES
jgi:hypothetical protein